MDKKILNVKKLINSFSKLKTTLAKERFIEILINFTSNSNELKNIEIQESDLLNILELMLEEEKSKVIR